MKKKYNDYKSVEMMKIFQLIRKPLSQEDTNATITAETLTQVLYGTTLLEEEKIKAVRRIGDILKKSGFPSMRLNRKTVFGIKCLKPISIK